MFFWLFMMLSIFDYLLSVTFGANHLVSVFEIDNAVGVPTRLADALFEESPKILEFFVEVVGVANHHSHVAQFRHQAYIASVVDTYLVEDIVILLVVV